MSLQILHMDACITVKNVFKAVALITNSQFLPIQFLKDNDFLKDEWISLGQRPKPRFIPKWCPCLGQTVIIPGAAPSALDDNAVINSIIIRSKKKTFIWLRVSASVPLGGNYICMVLTSLIYCVTFCCGHLLQTCSGDVFWWKYGRDMRLMCFSCCNTTKWYIIVEKCYSI